MPTPMSRVWQGWGGEEISNRCSAVEADERSAPADRCPLRCAHKGSLVLAREESSHSSSSEAGVVGQGRHSSKGDGFGGFCL